MSQNKANDSFENVIIRIFSGCLFVAGSIRAHRYRESPLRADYVVMPCIRHSVFLFIPDK